VRNRQLWMMPRMPPYPAVRECPEHARSAPKLVESAPTVCLLPSPSHFPPRFLTSQSLRPSDLWTWLWYANLAHGLSVGKLSTPYCMRGSEHWITSSIPRFCSSHPSFEAYPFHTLPSPLPSLVQQTHPLQPISCIRRRNLGSLLGHG
jgi:hypothetical protein